MVQSQQCVPGMAQQVVHGSRGSQRDVGSAIPCGQARQGSHPGGCGDDVAVGVAQPGNHGRDVLLEARLFHHRDPIRQRPVVVHQDPMQLVGYLRDLLVGRQPLTLVGIQQRHMRFPGGDRGEFPAQVDRIGDTRIHAEATRDAPHRASITSQKDPAASIRRGMTFPDSEDTRRHRLTDPRRATHKTIENLLELIAHNIFGYLCGATRLAEQNSMVLPRQLCDQQHPRLGDQIVNPVVIQTEIGHRCIDHPVPAHIALPRELLTQQIPHDGMHSVTTRQPFAAHHLLAALGPRQSGGDAVRVFGRRDEFGTPFHRHSS